MAAEVAVATAAEPVAPPVAAPEPKAPEPKPVAAAPSAPAPKPVRTSDPEKLMQQFEASRGIKKDDKADVKPQPKEKVHAAEPAPEAAPAPETEVEAKPEAIDEAEVAEAEKEIEEKPGAPAPQYKKAAPETLDQQHLKDIKDPDARKEVRRRLLRTRAYEEQFTIPEAKERKTLHPTIEGQREDKMIASDFAQIDQAFTSKHPQGYDIVASRLYQRDPEAFAGFTGHIAEHLETVNPDAYYGVATKVTDDLCALMEAKAKDNPEYLIARDYVRAALGLANDDGSPIEFQPPVQNYNDPAMRELAELRQREADRIAADNRAFHENVKVQFSQALTSEITAIIDAADPDKMYGPKTRNGLIRDIANEILSEVRQDPTAGRQTQALMTNGPRDLEHSQRVVTHLSNNARGRLARIAKKHLQEKADEFRTVQQQRADHQSRVGTAKDLGASGSPTPITPPKLRAGATMDEILEHAENLAAARRRR